MKACRCQPHVHTKLDICPVCDSPTIDSEKLRSEMDLKLSPKFMKSNPKPESTNKKAYTEMDYRNGIVPK
jgi:hypothetical protein